MNKNHNHESLFFFYPVGGGSSICRQSFHSMLFFKLVPVWTIPPLLCLLSRRRTHEVETPHIFWQRESDAKPRSMPVILKKKNKPHIKTAAPFIRWRLSHRSALCSPTPPRRSSWSSLSPRPTEERRRIMEGYQTAAITAGWMYKWPADESQSGGAPSGVPQRCWDDGGGSRWGTFRCSSCYRANVRERPRLCQANYFKRLIFLNAFMWFEGLTAVCFSLIWRRRSCLHVKNVLKLHNKAAATSRETRRYSTLCHFFFHYFTFTE